MVYLTNNSRAYSILEFSISFCIIFILIGTFGTFASKIVMAAREAALRNELYNLRLSLALYRVFNKFNPNELREIYDVNDYFVLVRRFGKDGRLADPFGNEYYYNARTGRVRSATGKYINW